MADPHDDNDHTPFLNSVDNAVIANSDTPVVSFALEFLYAWWKWIIAQSFNLGCNSPLDRPVKGA